MANRKKKKSKERSLGSSLYYYVHIYIIQFIKYI